MMKLTLISILFLSHSLSASMLGEPVQRFSMYECSRNIFALYPNCAISATTTIPTLMIADDDLDLDATRSLSLLFAEVQAKNLNGPMTQNYVKNLKTTKENIHKAVYEIYLLDLELDLQSLKMAIELLNNS